MKCHQDSPDLLSGAWKVPSAPVLIAQHRLCRAGLEGWRWLSGHSLAQSHPSTFHLKNIKHNFYLVGFLQEVQRCILGVFKRCSWTKKVWEHLGGVLGIPGSAAVGGDNIQGGRETALFCSIHDFWVLSSLVALAAQTLLTSLGLQERTVHYCYTKALLLQLTGSTVVTKGAFLLTNSSKKRSQIAWLLWWEANQLPG